MPFLGTPADFTARLGFMGRENFPEKQTDRRVDIHRTHGKFQKACLNQVISFRSLLPLGNKSLQNRLVFPQMLL
jgi:hypothetical protein